MRFGIYYAYWEKQWSGDYLPYIVKASRLGFDVLEVACGGFHMTSEDDCRRLRAAAQENGIILTGGYGPRPEHNLASSDEAVVKNAFEFYQDIFSKMRLADISSLGGALYSYWPVDCAGSIDKKGDLDRSVSNMRRLADLAAEYGISLYMEALNRFEGYLLNTAREAMDYVTRVGKSNVMILLDTFHMNIEEDSLLDAIRSTGDMLGELHIGEANRRPPCAGRMPWKDIGAALRSIGYDGVVVMEPFVMMGGEVGRDTRTWRNLYENTESAFLDHEATKSVSFIRQQFKE